MIFNKNIDELHIPYSLWIRSPLVQDFENWISEYNFNTEFGLILYLLLNPPGPILWYSLTREVYQRIFNSNLFKILISRLHDVKPPPMWISTWIPPKQLPTIVTLFTQISKTPNTINVPLLIDYYKQFWISKERFEFVIEKNKLIINGFTTMNSVSYVNTDRINYFIEDL